MRTFKKKVRGQKQGPSLKKHGWMAAAAVVPFTLAACNDVINNIGQDGQIDFAGDSNSIALVDNMSFAPGGPNDPGRVVCDPFESVSGPQASGDWGLAGTLYYLTADQPRYSTAMEYKQHGHQAPVSLFLNQLDVPTRRYDRAFYTQSGQLVTDVNGNAFYEYFGVEVDSQIQLADGEAAGQYQFAILSDDGAVIQMDTGSGMQTIVANDGVHPTRMACASAPVSIAAGQKIPMKLNWYQGPRYHISMVLMMRPWNEADHSDPECGQQGNSRYFDSSVSPSVPTSTFNALLGRGWKVLHQDNYALPVAIDTNPCRSPDPVRTFITRYTPDASVSNNPSVTFEFTSNYTTATFSCSLDGGAEVPCTSPATYSGLADGNHTFFVRASVGALTDETGATHSWRIDTLPPVITFIANSTTRTTIQLDFATSEPTSAGLKWGPHIAGQVNLINTVPESTDFLVNRTFLLESLNPATTYILQINGHDEATNSFQSPNLLSATRR
ncbi:MAG: hypothetical protein JNL01_15025 [Bdellovibrionales bacterium]|nr:hypothetical protein [Bdellovibrionales bacterium]